jgi:phage terminase Nu1 subunit (DNA packaging protein)
MTILTAHELARHYRVHYKTVLNWVKAGCPVENVGTPLRPDYRFTLVDVAAWLRRRHDAVQSSA